MSGEKNLPASFSKIKKARQKGDKPQQCIIKILVLFISFSVYIYCVFNQFIFFGKIFFIKAFSESQDVSENLLVAFIVFLLFSAIPVLICGVLGVITDLFNTKLFIKLPEFKLDFELNQIVSRFVRNTKNIPILFMTLTALLGLFFVITYRGGYIIKHEYRIDRIINGFFSLFLSWWVSISLILVTFSIIEWLVERRNFLKRNMMSLAELKEEIREDEGAPEMRAHRRALHEQLSHEEIIRRVRNSKVIVVDDTL